MSRNAPDGKPWPLPRIAVDTREQRPYLFGWEEGPPGELHGCAPVESLMRCQLGGPWPIEQRTLDTGDYQLIGPDGQLLTVAVVERKAREDAIASLTHHRERFMREMARMATFAFRHLVLELTFEDLVTKGRTRALPQGLAGSLTSIVTDYDVHVWERPNRSWGEWQAAWCLRRAWRWWLSRDAARLEAARALEEQVTLHQGVAPTADDWHRLGTMRARRKA
jgi:hypothetical protein